MLKINKKEGNWEEIEATEGWLHLKGDPEYSKKRRSPLLPGQTIDSFEELAELPPFTKRQYDEMVARLVRSRYSESEEFAIQRKYLNAIAGGAVKDPVTLAEAFPGVSEFEAYNMFVEECKLKARNPDLYHREEHEESANP